MIESFPEEQQQGIRLNGCYVCRLLYPDRDGVCEHCGSQTVFVAAQMMCEELIQERTLDLVREYLDSSDQEDGREKRLRNLLTNLHIYGHAAVGTAAQNGLDLDRLRAEFSRLKDLET